MQTAAPVLLLGGAAVASCVLLLMLRRRRGGAEALSPPSDTQNTQNKQHALSPPSDTQDKQSKRAAKKRRKQAAAADAQSTAATAQVPASTPTVVGSFTVAAGGQTLGELLCSQLPREFPSRGAAKRLLGRGQVLLDGDPADGDATVPACGQLVEYVMMPRPRVHQAHNSGGGPPSLHLEWAHVDDHLAVCVKPQGVAVQGDQSACKLRHAVGWELPPPNHLPDPLAVARFVHRIDKATGGLLVLARTGAACVALSQAFANHEGDGSGKAVEKTYIAVVAGKLEGEGVVDAPVQGKRALSRWVSLSVVRSAASGYVSTLRLHPQTGRYHQLRRHLALELACPILGDSKYLSHEARAAELDGVMHLWASAIVLPHPHTGLPVRVQTDEPAIFAETRRREEAAAAAMGEAEWAAAASEAEDDESLAGAHFRFARIR